MKEETPKRNIKKKWMDERMAEENVKKNGLGGKEMIGQNVEEKELKEGYGADKVRGLYGSRFLGRGCMRDDKAGQERETLKMPDGFWEWEGSEMEQKQKGRDEGVRHTAEVRQAEYEVWISHAIEELVDFMVWGKWEELEKKMDEVLEKIQNMAFMEGYMYAISILQDGVWKK